MKYIDKNNKDIFNDIKYIIYEDLISRIEIYIALNYGYEHIYKVQAILNQNCCISFYKFYYLIPKNKNFNIFNYIKYKIKRSLE
jgi:hypothetical protein